MQLDCAKRSDRFTELTFKPAKGNYLEIILNKERP